MKHALFCGCSYTSGTGFELEAQEPGLWVNLLHQNTLLQQYKLLNAGKAGRSNAGIFEDACYNLLHSECAYAFVEWTSGPRYELELGLELYDTRWVVVPNGPARQHDLNDCSYSTGYLNNIRDRFVTLSHPHYEILNIVCYTNILEKLAKLKHTQIFFINGLCEWDHDYFTRLTNVLPSDYTPYTQKIINVDSRDDVEIFKLYQKIHDQYQSHGGIQQHSWLNLYSSMRSMKIDTNSDNMHPGTQSNQLYFTEFNKKLQEKISN